MIKREWKALFIELSNVANHRTSMIDRFTTDFNFRIFNLSVDFLLLIIIVFRLNG